MKTIKIIDLLVKIANGENVPIEIKYNGFYYRYEYGKYIWHVDEETEVNLLKECELNDEVEIIEENKKIEQIDAETFLKSPINIEVNELYLKTRELIDEVNKLKEEK